jgi:hypothetical protein
MAILGSSMSDFFDLLILSVVNFDLFFKMTSNVFEKHSLGVVNEAVVARFEFTDFAFVKGTISHIFTFVALFLDVGVRFLEN